MLSKVYSVIENAEGWADYLALFVAGIVSSIALHTILNAVSLVFYLPVGDGGKEFIWGKVLFRTGIYAYDSFQLYVSPVVFGFLVLTAIFCTPPLLALCFKRSAQIIKKATS